MSGRRLIDLWWLHGYAAKVGIIKGDPRAIKVTARSLKMLLPPPPPQNRAAARGLGLCLVGKGNHISRCAVEGKPPPGTPGLGGRTAVKSS